MRGRVPISCILLCLCIGAPAQIAPISLPKVPVPESGFVSLHQYTNSFFGFSMPLPNDRHFRFEDLSETENRAVQHFLFAEKSMDKGLTLLIVSATQVLNSRADDAQKAAFLPGMQGTKGPEGLAIGGRLFWKSDVLEKTFSGKLRRLRYATSLGGFVLQFSISAYSNRTAEELKESIESIKFFDPAKAGEIAGADARPFLPQAARMRIAGAPQVDIAHLDVGRVSGSVYVNSYFGFSYRFADGWHVAGDPKPEGAGLAAPGQALRPAIPGPPEKCSRGLLRATRDAEPGEAQSFRPEIMVVAADPGCFALDAKFPTSLHDEQAMQLFGQAMVRAFSGTQLTRQDSVTLRGVNVDDHIFLEMPNDTAIPVPGSTLLKKIHSSLVLTSIKDYWVVWIFQSESESELDQIMKSAISFAGEASESSRSH